jgi:quercetin 2,3-dioxygenase
VEKRVEIPDSPYAHAYVARGRMNLEEGDLLEVGDAARLTAHGARRLEAVEPSEVLIWEMHATLGARP